MNITISTFYEIVGVHEERITNAPVYRAETCIAARVTQAYSVDVAKDQAIGLCA